VPTPVIQTASDGTHGQVSPKVGGPSIGNGPGWVKRALSERSEDEQARSAVRLSAQEAGVEGGPAGPVQGQPGPWLRRSTQRWGEWTSWGRPIRQRLARRQGKRYCLPACRRSNSTLAITRSLGGPAKRVSAPGPIRSCGCRSTAGRSCGRRTVPDSSQVADEPDTRAGSSPCSRRPRDPLAIQAPRFPAPGAAAGHRSWVRESPVAWA